MDQPELGTDPRFAQLKERVAHMDIVDEIVTAWTATRTTDDLFQELIAARVPCAPVRTLDEVIEDPNMHARRALERIDHPELGPIIVQNSPLRFDGLEPHPLEPSRPLGADTAAVLAGINLDAKTADRLSAKSVAGI